MENSQKLDITSLPHYEDVCNILYKLIAEQLMQPSLLEQIGYDLANCMFNMPYELLQQKHKDSFARYIHGLLAQSAKLSVITSDLVNSEEELFVLRTKWTSLKVCFDLETEKPSWIPNVTEVQVCDPESSQYTKQYIVRKMYYSSEFNGWFIEASEIDKINSKCIFNHTQLTKINER